MGEEQATVLVVEDEEALDRLDGADVVLLDRLMPGMTGEEVLGEIRERTTECRVAMVTAVEPDFDILGMGFDDYLTKPVGREELLETVDGLLARGNNAAMERKLYALASKRATLQSAKPRTELDGSEEFQKLECRIEELRTELNTSMAEIDDGEFVAMVREIEDEAEGGGSE